jgi:ferredoxin
MELAVAANGGGVLASAAMTYRVRIEGCADGFSCREDESVLAGMARLGRRGIPVGCRGGGCGVCLVEILAGDYRALPMSRTHVSAEDEAGGRVLACRVQPRSDLEIRVLGRMQRPLFGSASPSQ